MYKAKIGDQSFDVQIAKEGTSVNDSLLNWDITKIEDSIYHVIDHHKSYRMELVSIDKENKTVTLKLNGKLTTVEVKDKMDLLLEKMGIDMSAASQVNDIKAPMPGLILEIQINEGDEVQKGDPIMILEAMKMENVLKSPGDGIVKAIKVTKGDSVEKNQVLVEF